MEKWLEQPWTKLFLEHQGGTVPVGDLFMSAWLTESLRHLPGSS